MQETHLNGEGLDIVSENVSKLKELFPEIVTEDKIDFDKLKTVLGNYIEDDSERYNFFWKGKSASINLAQSPSTGTLRPTKEESKNWDTTGNIYIEGDNLEVLKLLQKSYYGKIKMIYIDPPYNTGNDFIYSDDYHENLQNYLKLTNQVGDDGNRNSTNSETDGRYHTNWLNMMYPRLRLARNLISEDGVIFVSIGEIELPHLRLIMNDIFGEYNYLTTISRITKAGSSSGDYFSPAVDFILVYSKNKDYCPNFIAPYSEEQKARYTEKDEKYDKFGPYMIKGLYQSSLKHSGSRYFIKCPDGNFAAPPENKVWRWNEETFKKGLDDDRIVFKKSPRSPLIDKDGNRSNWNIYTKTYLYGEQERGVTPKNYINEFIDKILNSKASRELSELNIPFDYPKPSELIKYLISFIVKKEDIILDFFAGSSTTAHAIFDLNKEDKIKRKFILVQLPEKVEENSDYFRAGYKNICEIGKERIRRVGDKILSEIEGNSQTSLDTEQKTNNNLDIGFKVFKLDSSNLSKWDPEYDNIEQTLLDSVENLVPGRSELDLIYEIMLKYGIDLTLPIEEYRVKDGKVIYSIGFGALLICLNDNLSINIATDIIKLKEELSPEIMRVVFKDNGFATDSEKTNIKETLKTHGINDFVTI